MQNVRHIAHTMQNDGHTMQNVILTTRNVGCNTLNICQVPKGGLEVPPSPRAPRVPPTPILEKNFSV